MTFTFAIKKGQKTFSLVIETGSETLNAEIDEKMELRWSNTSEEPTRATLYFMTGAEGNVSYQEKYKRMKFFETCIAIFDSHMVPFHADVTEEIIENLAQRGKMPRLEILEAWTQTRGLQKLFRKFGTENGNTYELRWNDLVSAAHKGEILKLWVAQKKESRKGRKRKTK